MALLIILGVAFLLAGMGAYIMILVDAFQDAIWKGILMLIPCVGGLFWLYYVIWEYESDYKFGIVVLAIFGNGIGWTLIHRGLAGGHF